jgi:caspase domain-containing protein
MMTRAMRTVGRRALLIAVENFEDQEQQEIRNLLAPRKDVEVMRGLLGSPQVGEFDLGPPCTDERDYELRRRIYDFFATARRDEVLLFYFAGHGMLDDDGALYLAASNTERNRLAVTGIPARFLLDRIRESQSQHVFVILDCCYAARLAEYFRGPDDEVRLDDQFDGPSAGISILSSSSQLQLARESPEQSVFARAVIAGLEDGAADLNGDGLIHVTELYDFLRRRLEDAGDRQRPRLLHDTGGNEPHIARVPGGREPVFDCARYEKEVLEPAATAGNRATRDIVRRYFLGGDFDNPDHVIDWRQVNRDVERVMGCWHQQHGVAYRAVVRSLEKEHAEIYQPLFDELRNGNAEPLRNAIQVSRRTVGLVDRILALTDESRLIDPELLDQFYAEGSSRSAVEEALDAAGVEAAPPWAYPPDPPAPGLARLADDLAVLEYRHIGDLLYPPDRRSGRVAVAADENGDVVVDRGLLEAAVAGAPGRWAGRELDAAQRILRLLEALEDHELRDLLTQQILTRLRPPAADRADLQRLLSEAQQLGLGEKTARRIAYVLLHCPVPRTDERTGRLLALVAKGRVAEAVRDLAQDPADQLPPGLGVLADQVRGWLARGEEWLRKAHVAAAQDTAVTLIARARTLIPDLTVPPELLRRLAPPPVTGLDHKLQDGRVLVTWQRSTVGVSTVSYVVRRYQSTPRPRPDRGGIIVNRTPHEQTLDERAPVNERLWYTVTAERDGVIGDESDPHGPVLVQPEVTDERITGDDGTVEIRWRTPPQALKVLIFRTTGQEPSQDQGPAGEPYAIIEAGAEDRYVDTGVVNERYYGYWLVVAYWGAEGAEQYTNGRFVGTTPAPPPRPGAITNVTLLSDDPARLAVEVAAPTAGRLCLLAAYRTPPPAGTLIRASLLPQVGDVLSVSQHEVAEPEPSVIRLLVEPPAAETTLVMVTVSGERAALGPRLRWRPVVNLGPVFAERRGNDLRVFWDWPSQGLEEVLLRWQQPGQSQVEMTVTWGNVAQFPVTGASVSLAAFPVFRIGPYRLTGRPSSADVVPRPVVEYFFDRVDIGLFHRLLGRSPKLSLRLVARQEVSVPRLLLVGKPGPAQPLTPDGCDRLLTKTDLPLPADEPVSFELSPLKVKGRYWLACFAPESGIDLRDPPVENRRIR